MTTDEAYMQMKRRGWGFAVSLGITIVGPILNQDYIINGEYPIIEAYGSDVNPVKAVEKAIAYKK